MNTNQPAKPCTEFEILISCDLDGELTDQEQTDLSKHLVDCQHCRDWRSRLEQVDRRVQNLGESATIELPAGTEFRAFLRGQIRDELPGFPLAQRVEKKPKVKQAQVNSSPRARLAWTGLAVTAAVLFMILTLAWPLAEQPPSEGILAPLVALSEINSQRIQDQKLFRDSLELDLRTLKLQLASIASGSEPEAFLGRIDRLMDRIDAMEHTDFE